MARTDTRTASNSRRFRILAVTALALLLGACSATGSSDTVDELDDTPVLEFEDNPATGTPIRVGLINPEGGTAISWPANREAAEAAVQYANANLGGLAGHPIELVTCRTKEDGASNRDCANRMVEEQVSAVITLASAYGDDMAPIITGAGIPYFTPSGPSVSELTSPGSYVLAAGFPAFLRSMAEHSADQGWDNVTVFITDNGAAATQVKVLGEPAFAEAGVELQVVPIPLGTPDTTPQVGSGTSSDVDAVAVIGDGTMCTSVLKSLAALGATQEKLVIQPCLDPAAVSAVGNELEGARVFLFADMNSDHPEAVLYRNVMRTYAPETDIQGFTYSGYQAVLALVRATESLSGEPTPDAVSAAIESAQDIPMPVANDLTFTCDGSALPDLPAVCSTQVIVATVENGIPVEPTVTG